MEFVNSAKKSEMNDADYIEAFENGTLKDGGKITLKGYIHKIKEMSGFAFVNVRTPRYVFQCIWDEKESKCSIKDFENEDCIVLDGHVVYEKRSKLGFDVAIENMTKLSSPSAPLPVEINNDNMIKKLQINTLLDNRIITLRNPKVRAVMKINEGVMHGFRTFLRNEGFTEFVPPKIVEAGAEGGADMFEVDYFGKKAYLNQSPQMYKQAMVGVFNKVFTVGPVFRGEKHSTNRHINEFQGLDLEMGFINSFEDLMELESRMFKYIFELLNTEYQNELDIVLGKGKRLPELKVFPKIKFSEVKELYAKAHKKEVLNPADLEPDEEKWIGEYFLKEYDAPIVFITHYPAKKRPFYAMDDPENKRYTLSYDMLLYGLEVTTGGQRIHNYDDQVAKMKERGMEISDFEDYLTMHKFALPPHGGFGLGLERIVQKLMNLDSIREATAFPRDRDRLRP